MVLVDSGYFSCKVNKNSDKIFDREVKQARNNLFGRKVKKILFQSTGKSGNDCSESKQRCSANLQLKLFNFTLFVLRLRLFAAAIQEVSCRELKYEAREVLS